MNNKSKELSRLLGIEPKSQCELSPVDECCELECPCVECELDKPNIYPDFTKPSNFMKLLELYHNYNFPYFNGFEKRTALETMQCQLVNKCIRMLELKQCGAFKKLAQQTEWSY